MAKRIRRGLALFASATLLLAGCGGESGSAGLGVEVSFDPGIPLSTRDQAVRVEVYLIASCDDVSMGERPASWTASTYVLREGGDPSLGDAFDPGDYGLYALAKDANCAVIAAGCVGADGQGSLEVTLSAFSSGGCSPGRQCMLDTGDCVNIDCTGAPDETLCGVGETAGVCRMGTCCTECWDGTTCQFSQSVNCGGQLCGSSNQCLRIDCAAAPDETLCGVGDRDGVCRMGTCCTECWDGTTCQFSQSVNCGGQLCGSSNQCQLAP